MTFLDYYKTYKSDPEHIENAFKYLVDYNHVSNKFNDDKLETPMHLNMERNQPTVFIPGMIYTFMYASPDKQILNDIEFIDHIPLMMVFDRSDSNIMGLNFNLIPHDLRAVTLDFISETGKRFYPSVIGDDTFKTNDNLFSVFANEKTRTDFIKLLNDTLTSKISAAYRIYKMKYCKNVRLIEYDM